MTGTADGEQRHGCHHLWNLNQICPHIGLGQYFGIDTVSGTRTGCYQNYSAYSRIPPQPTPAADTYEDSIVATVTY